MPQGPVSVERELIACRAGLTLWNEPELARQAAQAQAQAQAAASGQPQPAAPEPQVPWTLGGDLEKYRAHAVKDGSRDSGESLQKALERTGMTLGDGANVFVLGYASDRAKPFRANDGKGLFQEPGKVPERAGATIGSLGFGLYSILDLVTLNALPDPNKPVYQDNNPLVRPVIFTGRTIGGVWKTTEEVGNAVTWGLFDNVTGCVGLVIEDIVEVMKHAGRGGDERGPRALPPGGRQEDARGDGPGVGLDPARSPGVGQQRRGDEGLLQYAGLQDGLCREGRHRFGAGIRRLDLHRVPGRGRAGRQAQEPQVGPA